MLLYLLYHVRQEGLLSSHKLIITHADSFRWGRVFTTVCLSVCLCVCLSARYLTNTTAASITKRSIEIAHHESWKPIYFWVKRSKTVPEWVLPLL